MKKSILNLAGTLALDKNAQKSILGGACPCFGRCSPGYICIGKCGCCRNTGPTPEC